MADKEKKNLKEGEEDLEKNDRPLSHESWIMFLSGEIHNCSLHLLMIATVVMACVLACIGGIIAGLKTPLSIYVTSVLLFLALFSGLGFIKKYYAARRIIGELDGIREDIISGESDLNKIWRKWGKIHKILYPKKRSRGLEKSEIDDKSETMRTHSANFWYALGGSCIAIGGVFFSGFSLVSGFLGLILVIAGLFMLWGAYRAETDLKFFVEPSWKVKDLTPNTWLFVSFCLIKVWVVLVWAIIVYRTLSQLSVF